MSSITATIPTRAAEARRRQARAADGAARARRRAEDRALVEAIRRGEEDAFRKLVERYQKPLFWVAHDVLLDADEARDVVQEAFIRVFAAIDRFDVERDFLNWIFRIARNLAIDAYRRRRRRAIPVDDTALRHGTGLAEHDARSAGDRAEPDLKDHVSDVLASLPVDYRVALTLREFHGLTPREIAAVTDCSYPTARWRLHRARALFRRAWEERHGAPASDGESV